MLLYSLQVLEDTFFLCSTSTRLYLTAWFGSVYFRRQCNREFKELPPLCASPTDLDNNEHNTGLSTTNTAHAVKIQPNPNNSGLSQVEPLLCGCPNISTHASYLLFQYIEGGLIYLTTGLHKACLLPSCAFHATLVREPDFFPRSLRVLRRSHTHVARLCPVSVM